jgi:hypothetical protein
MTTLSIHRIGLAVATLVLSGAALAQTPAATAPAASAVARNVRQEQRIEQGLKSGELSTAEAAHLQKQEAKVDHMQAHALKDGQVSDAEKQRIAAQQNQTSQAIREAKTNEVKGNPNSASSQRMQAEVHRDVKQQARIEQGLKSGELSNHEAARLERGQSHVAARQAHVGKDGQVSHAEQHRINRAQNHQSRRIHRQKHDAQHAAAR